MLPRRLGCDLRPRQNYTGYLVNPTDGDTTQQTNDSVTTGFVGTYRRRFRLFSPADFIGAGVSLRHDWIDQSELDGTRSTIGCSTPS